MIKNGYAFDIDDPNFSEILDKTLRNIGDIMDHWAIVRDTEKEQKERKEENMFDFGNMFNGMFKPVAKGYCKMGANGKIAIKVQNGYKTFNVKTMKLTNCDNFAFDMDGAFWVVPTFKVAVGDIILVNNEPRAVIEVGKNSIKTFSYKDSTIQETIPEIFSPFMNMTKDNDSMSSMMSMMMMSQMFNGNNTGGSMNMGGMNPMMFMMMGNGGNMFENMFDGAFDFGDVPVISTDDEEDED